MGRINELRLTARVAQMYHSEGRRQAEIADHLHMSQATISRMLKRAEKENIVRTTVIPPLGTFVDLEAAVREQYGIGEVIVVDCTEDREGAVMARIGEAAAHFFEVTVQPGEIVGVSSWSETILRMVDNIHPLKGAKAKFVVQMLGGMGDPSVQAHATQLITRFANLTGAESRLLSAPGVANSLEAKDIMLADPFVRETMDLFGKITLAVIGIGAVKPSGLLASSGNIFSSRELAALTEAGAVGDMSLRFFDLQGQPVRTALDERVIGLPLEALARIPRVMALAGGASKTLAIKGALRTGAIDVFVTDKFTAARLAG